MTRSFRLAPIVVVLGLVAASPGAIAQGQTWRLTCSNHGNAVPEPLGDRPGHALQASESTCTVAGGPMDGGVTSQNAIWEVDGAKWTLIVSTSLTRRPDGRLLGLNTVGTLDVQMQDGRPVGWTASGQGKVALASGKAAALAGKAYTWTGRTTAPGVYILDVTMP